jgi:hypothetical protein
MERKAHQEMDEICVRVAAIAPTLHDPFHGSADITQHAGLTMHVIEVFRGKADAVWGLAGGWSDFQWWEKSHLLIPAHTEDRAREHRMHLTHQKSLVEKLRAIRRELYPDDENPDWPKRTNDVFKKEK